MKKVMKNLTDKIRKLLGGSNGPFYPVDEYGEPTDDVTFELDNEKIYVTFWNTDRWPYKIKKRYELVVKE